MGKPKVLKPYIKSSAVLDKNWKALNDLEDLKKVLEESGLRRKDCKGEKRRLKDAKKTEKDVVNEPGPSGDEVKMETDEKTKIFIGMKSTLRELNDNGLGAFIIDEKVVGPSAIAHVFNLVSLNPTVDFYKVNGLSGQLKGILNMPKVSCIGIGKDEPIVIQLKLSTEVKIKDEVKPVISFKKPQFRTPIGKSKDKKGKKKGKR